MKNPENQSSTTKYDMSNPFDPDNNKRHENESSAHIILASIKTLFTTFRGSRHISRSKHNQTKLLNATEFTSYFRGAHTQIETFDSYSHKHASQLKAIVLFDSRFDECKLVDQRKLILR